MWVYVGRKTKGNLPWQLTMVASTILSPLTTTLVWLCVYVCVGLTFHVNRDALDSISAKNFITPAIKSGGCRLPLPMTAANHYSPRWQWVVPNLLNIKLPKHLILVRVARVWVGNPN